MANKTLIIYHDGATPPEKEAKRFDALSKGFSKVHYRNARRFLFVKNGKDEIIRHDCEPCDAIATDNENVAEAYERYAAHKGDVLTMAGKPHNPDSAG